MQKEEQEKQASTVGGVLCYHPFSGCVIIINLGCSRGARFNFNLQVFCLGELYAIALSALGRLYLVEMQWCWYNDLEWF
jgi:hypothetical protein